MAKQNGKQGMPQTQNDPWAGVAPAPPPVVVDGFFVFEEGAAIEGVVVGTGETRYGPYYAIKVKVPNSLGIPTRFSQDKEYKDAANGQTIGVSDRAALRSLDGMIAKGPTAVRIYVKGKNGKAWDLDFRAREAF